MNRTATLVGLVRKEGPCEQSTVRRCGSPGTTQDAFVALPNSVATTTQLVALVVPPYACRVVRVASGCARRGVARDAGLSLARRSICRRVDGVLLGAVTKAAVGRRAPA